MTAAGHDGTELHELLRDLVARQGPGVVETAEGFRAALDDFLTEDEASTGELNLLVDAVRLGAVQRLLSILDHGGDPTAAIGEAGETMARDRGTDDSTRARWAVAALGFALGRLTEDDVRRHLPGRRGVWTTEPTPDPAPPPPPVPTPEPEPARAPPTEVAGTPGPATLGDRAPEQVTWDHAAAAPPPAPPSPPSRDRRAWPAVAAVVVLLAVGGAVGWRLYDSEDPDSSTGDGDTLPEAPKPSVAPDIDLPTELSSSTILISAKDGEDALIYRVDADTGAVEQLTSGPGDNFPTISRDREQVVFLVRASENAVRPMVLDLASGDIHALFRGDGACDYGRRPGWDLSGERLALVCLTADGEETGIFVVDLRGRLIQEIQPGGSPRGSPTWISEDEFVYARAGGDGDPTTLWRVNVTTGAERELTTGPGWDSQPVWSRSRDRLLFVRSDSPSQFGELWTIDDRAVARRLPIDEPASGPVWSPGGGQIAFTVEGDDGPVLVTAPSDDPAGYTPVDGLRGRITVPVWDTR